LIDEISLLSVLPLASSSPRAAPLCHWLTFVKVGNLGTGTLSCSFTLRVIVSESPRKSEQPFTLGGVSVTAILARRAALDGDEDDDDNSEWDDDEWDDDEWDEQL
jgi:hypothetical protein